eukprot:INCI13484.13.p1 GENE.INCI13484.13~~INCI13484.13.p1  ORF type:complete len:314 (+),score=57.72 INCI13484.13:150-1091(+)
MAHRLAALPAALLALLGAASAPTASSASLTVATLSSHNPTSWSSDSACSVADDRHLVDCNLRVYAAAVEAAVSAGDVDVVLFPEGYALAGGADKSTFLEQLAFKVGDTPCASHLFRGDNSTTPQQTTISCLASKHSVAIAANVFTVNESSKDAHISEITFDSTGAVSSIYHKHHLFLTENAEFKPGPFNPTVYNMDVAGDTWRVGVIVCWEGFYPSVTGDWSQLDAFHAQNASLILWSIGTSVEFIKDVSMDKTAALWASKYNVSVAATVDEKKGVAFSAGGVAATEIAYVPITGVDGYTASDAAVSVFSIQA